jgi:NAD(P)-dependent dehydrogenase (short-subunit alcohol dehydrogenase family)
LHAFTGMRIDGWIGKAIGVVAAALVGRAALRRHRRIDLRGRTAVITGASRGLGLLLARELARHGADLAILARTAEDLAAARAELGDGVLAIRCDVSVPDEIEAAIADVLSWRGRIDLLVNNAGVIQVGPLEHMSEADFDQSMAVHFWGPLYAMLAVVPIMRAQGGGRIVNISSIGGVVAVPHLAPYCASKFALTGLSDALRAELKRDRIHVTTVCPGLMRTGSYLNVDVKGQHRQELTWFGLGSGAPLVSMNAERAARRIVRAARDGEPVLHLGTPARALIIAHALAPGLIAEVMALINQVMPGPAGRDGDLARTGWQSASRWAPSTLTRLADRAAARNNELRGHISGP